MRMDADGVFRALRGLGKLKGAALRLLVGGSFACLHGLGLLTSAHGKL